MIIIEPFYHVDKKMTQYNIGIDALADVPEKSGQINIHRNILRWLPSLAKDWTFYVFSTPNQRLYYEKYGMEMDNLRWVYCWADNAKGTIKRIITQEIQLSFLARKIGLDCVIVSPLPFLFPFYPIRKIYRHTLLTSSIKSDFKGFYRLIRIYLSAKYSDAVLCNSHFALYELERFIKRPIKKKKVIWESFDENIFSNKIRIDSQFVRAKIRNVLSANSQSILVPTGLQQHKNAVIIFEMLKNIRRANYPLPHILFMGNIDRAYYRILRTKYPDYFKEGIVKVLGFCSHEELAYVAKHVMLGIYPSKYETFGLPPLEMMAVGLPVIVSQVKPMIEISGPGSVMFDPDNAEELAAKVIKLFKSPKERNSLAQRGYEFIKRYSWKRNALETLSFIESVVENKSDF
ncbi:MAG: glycosyltransferase [Thermodesulfobacteriota bacterium]|nr:glycosyltransferase [Thermodesulfobacteriota bacterium]